MFPLTSQHVLGALGTGVTKSFTVGSFPAVGGAVCGGGGSLAMLGIVAFALTCIELAVLVQPHQPLHGCWRGYTAYLVTCQRKVGGQPPSLQSANEENGVLMGSVGDDLGRVGCTWATGPKDVVSEPGEGSLLGCQ